MSVGAIYVRGDREGGCITLVSKQQLVPTIKCKKIQRLIKEYSSNINVLLEKRYSTVVLQYDNQLNKF